MGDLYGYVRPLANLDGFRDGAQERIALAANVAEVVCVKLVQDIGKADKLFRVRIGAGWKDETTGHAKGAILQRLAEVLLLRGNLLGLRVTSLDSHCRHAYRHVADKRHDVQGRSVLIQGVQVLAERHPLPP